MTRVGAFSERRTRWRERVASRLPRVLLESSFEAFIGPAAVLIGLSILLGGPAPSSLATLLPEVGVLLYGVALILGGAATTYGAGRRFQFVTAMGLRLLMGAFLIYAGALVTVAGLQRAGFAAAIFALVGAFCGFRSFYLRTLVTVRRRVAAETGQT